jgi:D-glycero-alpha-D-manno-heptose 1-phosphate guanylyltransferase
MQAIILAGGLGTRLRQKIYNIPKVMAPINQKPFLEYILEHLNKQGFKKVILAVGYKREYIISYFGYRYKQIELIYSIEKNL